MSTTPTFSEVCAILLIPVLDVTIQTSRGANEGPEAWPVRQCHPWTKPWLCLIDTHHQDCVFRKVPHADSSCWCRRGC